jgi:hypothetical protein
MSKKYRFKKIEEKLRKLETEPEEHYGFIENNVWYPNTRFIEEAHDMLIREYSGYTGYETGINLFQTILKQARETAGI